MIKLKVAHKLLLGFGVVMALSVGIGWHALEGLSYLSRLTSTVSSRDIGVLELIRRITVTQDEMKVLREQSRVQNLLRVADPGADAATGIQAQWRQARLQTGELLIRLRDQAAENVRESISADREAGWRQLQETAQAALPVLEELGNEVMLQFEIANQGDLSRLDAREDRLARLRNTFDAKLDAATELVVDMAKLGDAASLAAYRQTRLSLLLALASVVVLGALSIVLIQRSITRPLREFIEIMGMVGGGDLTRQAQGEGGDEFAQLGATLNRMVAGLRDLATQLSNVTGNLGSAAAEILASTQQQAASTAEQAAAVQETTTTMEEITQSGIQVAGRAKEVTRIAETSSSASATGLTAVENSVRTIEGIREQAEVVAENIVALSEKTQAVGEIIALVTDVAEQSNLLALNAAIEAAAAGEQGRRFSVVASEIKNLADQAKNATAQVRSLLGDIQKGINTLVMLTEEAVKRVEAGKTQSEVAEHTIRQMADSTEESITAFQQILAATGQQQIGVEQVTEALKNIRQATEQTASGTSQLEKAAMSLNTLSMQLRNAVARYRL